MSGCLLLAHPVLHNSSPHELTPELLNDVSHPVHWLIGLALHLLCVTWHASQLRDIGEAAIATSGAVLGRRFVNPLRQLLFLQVWRAVMFALS